MPNGVVGQGSAPPQQIAQFRSDGFTGATGLRVPFFSDAFSRAFGFPDVRLINMVSEATPLREERQYVPFVGLREVRYSRPGLVSAYNLGTGPIRALFSKPGVFNQATFMVSGTAVFMNGANIGTIPGSDIVRFAASTTQVIAVANGSAYVYDGATYPVFTAIDNGILPNVIDVAYLGDRFAFVAFDSATFWYSELFDGTNVLGLDFASDEDSPASIRAVDVFNDMLVFFTGSTVDFWSIGTTDPSPFTPNEGSGYQRGIAARDTLCFADNALFWLGDNGVVYRIANSPDRISSSSVEDAIRRCADITRCTAVVATFEGHEFYVLNIWGVGSYAYDCSRINSVEGAYGDSYNRGEWAEWKSYGRQQFRGQVVCVDALNRVLVGDDTTNDVWQMQVGAWTDGATPLQREAFAFIKIEEGRPRMDGLVLHAVTGQGNATGPGMVPNAEMRFSDDMGLTWSRWRASSMGAQGQGTRVYWTRLGQMKAPGRLINVRCSDPVNVAFSHLELNPLRPAD